MANGDVKLSWVPPSDPGNVFFAYEIYSSAIASGPFTLVSPAISPISTHTFVHSGAQAGTQSKYYYMLCKYGTGGANSTTHSDTLKSIFLNIFIPTTSQDLKLNYNDLHDPKIQSSAPNFTIEKQYPVPTWKTFKVTPLFGYSDTISVCTASIYYRVSVSDNSGCISVSNTQGGIYHDSKQPNEPFVDSISVLPNGNTILAWHIPYDKDVNKYEIQRLNESGNRETLDLLSGRGNTAYTYTTINANKGPVALYVGSIDSCGKGSTFNYNISTMFLKTVYDRCAYTTQLNWNAYTDMPKGLQKYCIYYSINGAPYTIVGTTTLTSFIHTGAEPGKSLSYFVRAMNKDQSITSSSNRVQFFSSQVKSPDYVYIRSAWVTDKNTNVLELLLDTASFCTGIEIKRSVDGSGFTSVGFVPRTNTPAYTFYDTGIEPGKRSYYYQAIIRDSCGNARLQSDTARTILLKATGDEEQPYKRRLSWSAYEGFAGRTSGYHVYRVLNGVVEAFPIASTPSYITTYTDTFEEEASKGSKLEYLVTVSEGSGNPYGIVSGSTSNRVEVFAEAAIFVPNAFVPNGINRSWRPVTHFVDKEEYRVNVFDRWGRVVFKTGTDDEAWDGGDEPAGTYIYLISYKNSRGEYKEIRGSVNLIR